MFLIVKGLSIPLCDSNICLQTFGLHVIFYFNHFIDVTRSHGINEKIGGKN